MRTADIIPLPAVRLDPDTYDLTLAFAAALPEVFRTTESLASVLEEAVRRDPETFLKPLDQYEAAAFLGLSVGALNVRRARKAGPPFTKRDGVIRYPSRLELMNWMRGEPVDAPVLKEADVQSRRAA